VQHMQVKWSTRASGSGNQVGLRETFTAEPTVLRQPLRGNAETGHDRLLPNTFIQFRLNFAFAQMLYNFCSWNSVLIFVSKEYKPFCLPHMNALDPLRSGVIRGSCAGAP